MDLIRCSKITHADGGHWRLPMRFYFDFLSHDNDEILDCEGVELVDWLAAHCHAMRIVKQTVPFIPEGPDWRGWRIEVTDESRMHVLSVLFHARSRYAAPELTQTCLQTNVPDLTGILRGAEVGWRPAVEGSYGQTVTRHRPGPLGADGLRHPSMPVRFRALSPMQAQLARVPLADLPRPHPAYSARKSARAVPSIRSRQASGSSQRLGIAVAPIHGTG